MNEEENREFWDKVLNVLNEHANRERANAESLSNLLVEMLADVRIWEPSRIAWKSARHPSEDLFYEYAEDVDNLDFKAMLKDLEQNNGKLWRGDMLYWKFDNIARVGRYTRKLWEPKRVVAKDIDILEKKVIANERA